MRHLAAVLSLALAASANYMSQGWQPGQAVTKKPEPTATPGFDPAARTGRASDPPKPSGPEESFWTKFFTQGALGNLLQSKGVNVSAAIEKSRVSEDWDLRIPIVYDETYHEIITNETLTPEEEHQRVWFIVVCVFHSPLAPTVPADGPRKFGWSPVECRLAIRRQAVRRVLQHYPD